MSNKHWKAHCVMAVVGLILGGGIALADPVADQTQSRHKVSTLHRPAKPHPAVIATHNEQFPLIVASTLGSAAQSVLNCRGENAWSLLCPGSEVIGVSY